MTFHGFGIVNLRSSKSSMATNQNVAMCISRVHGVEYAHVVHKAFTYDSRVEEEAKNIYAKEVEPDCDIIIEVERKLSEEEIKEVKACASRSGHHITIKWITVQHPNWRDGQSVTHPGRPRHHQ